LLAGAVLAPGRRTVSTALRILGRERDRSSALEFVDGASERYIGYIDASRIAGCSAKFVEAGTLVALVDIYVSIKQLVRATG
jgi:hypothetical protein